MSIMEFARTRRPGWLAVALAGLLAGVASLALPWTEEDFELAPGTRIAMALAGVAMLGLVAWQRRGPSGGVLPIVGALGACVVTYPTVLAAAAASDAHGLWRDADRILGFLAGGWHVVPLLLVQLAPVAASTMVLRRRGRHWEWTIVVVGVVSTALLLLALAGTRRAELWAASSTVIFVASFALAPIATWLVVPGASGETRRRAILAGVAAMFPVVIIVGCTALGILAPATWGSGDLPATLLLLGFSAGTALCGITVVATTAPPASAVLRTPGLVAALDGLVAIVLLIVGLTVALVLPADLVSPGWALLVGGLTVAAMIVPWLRIRAWIAVVLDPGTEFGHELTRHGEVADGQQGQTVALVLRRLVDDPELQVFFRIAADIWIDVDGQVVAGSPPAGVPLAQRGGGPTVLAYASGPQSEARLAALGDVGPACRGALLEAAVVHETARAATAADEERQAVERDLHDGLQGRLIGLALDLQLSGRDIEDPNARLLIEQTVQQLRSTVDDVRALGRGRQPELLGRSGLAPALGSLFQHARPTVSFDIPPTRFPATAETAAYFVVGEAVTNALKHAAAEHIEVQIRADGPALTVTVSDDGRGGADPRLGTGLRGLAERVASAGGALVVRDSAPTGTVVEAVVPCGS